MKAIIIGAGRGIRLMPHTTEIPKCLVEVGDKMLLEYTLDALKFANVEDIHFIGGYRIEEVQHKFTDLHYHYNDDWENNNILASLMYASSEMDGGFISIYSDIIFPRDTIARLLATSSGLTIVVDPNWQKSYLGRTEHPESQAEKVIIRDGKVVEIGKHLTGASAEFIGIAKFSHMTANVLCYWYKRLDPTEPFHAAVSPRVAYLTDMIQEFISLNIKVEPLYLNDDWRELDTPQDLERMQAWLT